MRHPNRQATTRVVDRIRNTAFVESRYFALEAGSPVLSLVPACWASGVPSGMLAPCKKDPMRRLGSGVPCIRSRDLMRGTRLWLARFFLNSLRSSSHVFSNGEDSVEVVFNPMVASLPLPTLSNCSHLLFFCSGQRFINARRNGLEVMFDLSFTLCH
jgi:hypothetical protein